MSVVLDQPNQIELFQWHAIRATLKLEMLGMKRSTKPSAFIIAKRKLAIKGGREKILEALENKIEELKCSMTTKNTNS